jgi:enterochelin esterase-like enzyme
VKIPALILLFAPASFAPVLLAQATLTLNQTVAREIAPGTTHSYSIRLDAGDYVSGSITRHGAANIVIFLPEGALLRRFPAPPGDSKREFAFAAETTGVYRIELGPTAQAASYELMLTEVLPLSERLKPQPWSDPYPSPRMEALRKQVASGQTSTELFWKQVTQEGTPLAEPFETDGKYQLVTFLWRGARETRNVLVIGSFNVPRATPLDYAMHRLADTDVWYLTVKLPAGARFEYQLSPNDPLVFDGPRSAQRSATAQADPLNSHRWSCLPNSSKYACQSEAELPGAAPQAWIVNKPGTPAGRIEKQQIRSEIQKLDRPFSVYTPPGYRADGQPNALLVIFDAETYLNDEQRAPTTLNNLIAASKIPATVGVFVSNVGDRRLKDLVPNPEFADSMSKELIPWVRAHYNVTKDPAQTVVGGYSAGGLAAAYVGLCHPEVFGGVLSQSGSFWWAPGHGVDDNLDATTETNGMAKQFIASPKLPLKFYMDAGTFEGDSTGQENGILEPSRHLRDVLLAKGYEVHYRQFVGGHDGLSWRGTLADGLIALIGIR